MQYLSSTARAWWRGAIVALALVVAAELAIEGAHAPRVLAPGVARQPLGDVRFLRERGPTTFVVYAMQTESPLVALGVVPGDRLQPLSAAPEHFGADDEAVLAMQAHATAHRMRNPADAGGAVLAVPMLHRGQLDGFVLVGRRPRGDAYRPDQIELLQLAVRQVGLDFYALRVEDLERRIDVERRSGEVLRAQLETAMQMSGAPGMGRGA